MLSSEIQFDRAALASLCRDNGVARLSLFGSALRGDFDPGRSDIDLLVDFQPGAHKGLFKLLQLQNELTRLFGRTVDLTTAASLSKYFREDVLARAQVLYDAA